MSKMEFEDISIPKWKLSIGVLSDGVATKAYRVFSSPKEFVTIDAISATDAVAKSGVAKVFMVKIGAKDDMSMLDRSMLFAATDSVEAAPVVEVVEQTPPATA